MITKAARLLHQKLKLSAALLCTKLLEWSSLTTVFVASREGPGIVHLHAKRDLRRFLYARIRPDGPHACPWNHVKSCPKTAARYICEVLEQQSLSDTWRRNARVAHSFYFSQLRLLKNLCICYYETIVLQHCHIVINILSIFLKYSLALNLSQR